MSRYGLPKYGTVKYGATPATNTLSWAIEVDWNGDTMFSGANEAKRVVGFSSERGRENYIRLGDNQKAVGFEHVDVGRAVVTLDNVDGRYDPYNTTSPLYPLVAPGKLIRVRVQDDFSGAFYSVISGKIKDIQPISGDQELVHIEIEDGLRDLQDSQASIALQENIRLDNAIIALLDDALWPAYWGRTINPSTETPRFWWADSESHRNACNDLADTDLGVFFVAADGKATFNSRNTGGIIMNVIDQSQLLKEITLRQPWESNRDKVIVIAHPRILRATGTLWTLLDTPLIAASGSITVWGGYAYNNQSVPAKNVLTPAATTDYTMNTLADGTGTNLTANFTVTATKFSETSMLVIKNNGGTAGYITLLKIRGDAIDAPDPVKLISGTGQRVFELDTLWLQDTTQASNYAKYLQDFLSGNLLFPIVQIEARPALQFPPDLFSSMAVTITKKNINENFRAGKITHEWLAENGQAVLTRFWLEPYVNPGDYWRFTATMGVTTIFPL